jgi:hypothetical protein
VDGSIDSGARRTDRKADEQKTEICPNLSTVICFQTGTNPFSESKVEEGTSDANTYQQDQSILILHF